MLLISVLYSYLFIMAKTTIQYIEILQHAKQTLLSTNCNRVQLTYETY